MSTAERILLEEPLDLDATLGCGQAFRWEKAGDWWLGTVGERALRLRQDGRLLVLHGADEAYLRHYLALDLDLDAILSRIDHDPVVQAAIEACYGLRIVRQPLFECLLSYLCATNTNIPAVRRRVAGLSARFGARVISGSPSTHAFPAPMALARATDEELRSCGLGYRAGYARRAVAALLDEPAWETRLRSLPHEEARRALMALPGIGPKAADCIALFALEDHGAFPVDVWIRRIVVRHYLPELESGPMTPALYETLRVFGRERFGSSAGYAQEYLYGARLRLCPDRTPGPGLRSSVVSEHTRSKS